MGVYVEQMYQKQLALYAPHLLGPLDLRNAEYSHKVAFLMGEYWYRLPLLMDSHRHAYKTLPVF